MSLKAKLEAIIYAAETPITLDHIVQLVKESVVAENAAGDAEDAAEVKSRVRAALEELIADPSTCSSRAATSVRPSSKCDARRV